MFKYIASIAATAAAVQATGKVVNPDAFELEAYTSEDCSGTAMIDTTLEYGVCTEVKNHVTVEELNNAILPVLKFSPDAKNEFYMFPNVDACKAYGNKFNAAVEVAFIRSPGVGCKECKQCGNVKSVKVTEVMMAEGTKKVKEDSAASAVAASSAALAASAAFAMLF